MSNTELRSLLISTSDLKDDQAHIQRKKRGKESKNKKKETKVQAKANAKILSDLMEIDLNGVTNVTNQNVSRVPHVNLESMKTRKSNRSLESFFRQIFTTKLLKKLSEFVNGKLAVLAAMEQAKNFPKIFKQQDIVNWIISEFCFTSSDSTSYSDFKSRLPKDTLSLGVSKYNQIRQLLVTKATPEFCEEISEILSESFRNIWISNGEEVIDELLSGWESKSEGDPLTYIPRKPHKLGLCYYFRVNRIRLHGVVILFCIDFVQSVTLPKVSAVEACQTLLNRSLASNPLLRSTVVMDSAFYSQDNIKWLVENGHNFILAGGAGKYPLITALALTHLPNNSHIMLCESSGLAYSFVKSTHFDPDTEEPTDTGCLKVTVSNIFSFRGKKLCTCINSVERNVAKELMSLSDETILFLGKKAKILERDRDSIIKGLTGCYTDSNDTVVCVLCAQSTFRQALGAADLSGAYERKKIELLPLKNPPLVKICKDMKIKHTGNKLEMVERIAFVPAQQPSVKKKYWIFLQQQLKATLQYQCNIESTSIMLTVTMHFGIVTDQV